jgi:hypothetical protein
LKVNSQPIFKVRLKTQLRQPFKLGHCSLAQSWRVKATGELIDSPE